MSIDGGDNRLKVSCLSNDIKYGARAPERGRRRAPAKPRVGLTATVSRPPPRISLVPLALYDVGQRRENWDAAEKRQWNFFKMGNALPHFLPLPFSSLCRLVLETISPFPLLGNSVLNKRKKLHFPSVIMSYVHLPYQNSFSIGH